MIKNITIDGKEYPLSISYYALKHTSDEVKKETGKDLNMSDILSEEITIYEPLLYFGLKAGHTRAKVEGAFPIKRDQMEFILDEVLMDFMKIVPEFFAQKEDVDPKPIPPKKEDKKIK